MRGLRASAACIPADALGRIKARARVDAARIDEIEATTRHDVIAFLTNLEEAIGADSRYVHIGHDLLRRGGHRAGAPAPAGLPSSCWPGLERFRGALRDARAPPPRHALRGAHPRRPRRAHDLRAQGRRSGTRRPAATSSASGGPARRCGWGRSRARSGPSPTSTRTSRRRSAACSGSRPRRSPPRSSSATATPSSATTLAIVAASLEKVAIEIRVAPAHRDPGGGGAVRGGPEGLERHAPQAQPGRLRARERARPARADQRPGRAGERGPVARARHQPLLGRAGDPAGLDDPAWTTCSTG